MAAGRGTSAGARLARVGFTEPTRAAATVDASHELSDLVGDERVLATLGTVGDPDAALSALGRLLDAAADPRELTTALCEDERLRGGLLAVLGSSVALGEHLARHPDHWRLLQDEPDTRPTADGLRARLLRAVGADPGGPAPVASNRLPDVLDALRVAYHGALLGLAARDVGGGLEVADVAAELADLAGATLEAALAIARAQVGPADAGHCRLAVVAMGKCGGRELNYVSDVDVVFVAEPAHDLPEGVDEQAALRTATALAVSLMRACSATTAEGTIWPVDAALRPEGKAGPLVRSLASHVAYYERWAKTWEFQALLKARPVAGDLALGQAYVDAVGPMVWQAADRPDFVSDVQQMRRRVEGTLATTSSHRELKLGPGGLRDVEFAVQLLQLVHGRSDETLRSTNTLEALESLSTYGYVGRADAASLDKAYRFLRSVEHRLQVHRLRRTHVMPEAEVELRRIGRSLGLRADPVGDLDREWRRHAREVRRLHEKLFYRPLLSSVARLASGEARLTPDAARSRLEALGYADPAGALRHLEALTEGVSRRAAIQRTLLPVLLGWFADAPDPDGGLLAFRQISDALGTTPWYLRVLRDEGAVAERMALLLASSRYAVELLGRAPEAVRMLADDAELVPGTRAELAAELASAVARHDDPETAVTVARGVRRRELFRVAAADLLHVATVEQVEEALTDVVAAAVQSALDVAVRSVTSTRGGALPTRVAVIAMGRFGGRELSYASDADVLFVHEPLEGAAEQEASEAAHAVVHELRRLLSVPSPDPPLTVDADLRPEGRQGPLVRTLASYAAYYDRWSHVWESQALLRADPVAGDADLGARFVELVDPLRYREGGLDEASVREIRRIKARVEAERLPRGADPARHTKLGPGGLADVEWTVQLLQLRHAAELPGLRTPRTLEALAAARRAGLVTPDQAQVLAHAWRTASRVRNAVLLVRGRPGDSLPTDLRELSGVARVLGYPPGASGELVDDYRRATRRARAVVERVFYR
ncbi:MAG TPA: bifunctional [glutamine synthetase] adenylyltransferase/[glutamine synthetase]-adenylyl-L-tyrosine phosphorylase [Actinomycetes bacterium]|nr:bifunctional [glutamine synthetase] adenylyltransferase/[glutamine synthetase]-adenylyl-L-tyrosine phosphorylase [Actinomycetes bacterium]